MYCKLKLEAVSQNTYDLIIVPDYHLKRYDTEFSVELFGKPIRLRMVTLLLTGTLSVSIPFSKIAEANSRYSMTYLSYGSFDKQLEYVE